MNYCRHEYAEAIELLNQSRATIAKSISPNYFDISISKYLMLAISPRAIERLADEYLQYGRLWQREHMKIDQTNYTLPEFRYHKLNQVIWAARYRALVGD